MSNMVLYHTLLLTRQQTKRVSDPRNDLLAPIPRRPRRRRASHSRNRRVNNLPGFANLDVRPPAPPVRILRPHREPGPNPANPSAHRDTTGAWKRKCGSVCVCVCVWGRWACTPECLPGPELGKCPHIDVPERARHHRDLREALRDRHALSRRAEKPNKHSVVHTRRNKCDGAAYHATDGSKCSRPLTSSSGSSGGGLLGSAER